MGLFNKISMIVGRFRIQDSKRKVSKRNFKKNITDSRKSNDLPAVVLL